MTDFPYKLGALPPQFPGGLRDLTYYVAGDLPAGPPSLLVPTFDWGMLGNDTHGDCGVAGFVHGDEAAACMIHANQMPLTEWWPSTQEVLDYYFTYTGGQDSGLVLSQFLQYVRANGMFGKKVIAYAPVAVHDVNTLRTANWLYGFVYCGITVTGAMQQASLAHQPWTTALLGQVIGGHCVPIVGYDDEYVYVITWGMVQAITWPMWHSISTEAWAVITEEINDAQSDGRGVVLSALTADLDKLAA